MTSPPIDRWPASAPGRSRAVAFDRLVWIVANAAKEVVAFDDQATQTLERLAEGLTTAGSDRSLLLSVQIFLADMSTKPRFDALWDSWIGDRAADWPQRVCIEAGLTGSLLVEIQAVAARR